MDFKSPYNRQQYISFFRNHLLPEDFEEHEEKVAVSFQPQFLQNIFKIGEVPSLELHIYEIDHVSENDPRVSISRESFRLLAQYGVKRALIVFTSRKSQNYRLSLVTIDLKWEEGKRVQKEYSNPRRYSFFLGPDTKTHTPEQYLISKNRIKDFDDLKNRFSIEVVNKEFYTEIARLFTQLAGGKREIGRKTIDAGSGYLKLPSTIDDTTRKEFTVRLIGRLVFCWFLKKKVSEKGVSLLPEDLLSSKGLSGNKNFYHAILEPLFFEVLNTMVERRDKKYKVMPWSQIPFLNGGLFTPHHNDFYEKDSKGNPRIAFNLVVPDEWLKDLFAVFETYNFTIDENTSVDVELSIEPEMLGRIFENLLAEINPETGETARKATGSYYTPRPIVEYMVDESLKQYLLTKTNLPEEKISALLTYDDSDSDLSEKQRQVVIEALDTIKIIDPACGSGAFPMGILQKMLLILQKVDPDSQNWLDKKLSSIQDATLRKDLKTKLKADNFNYIHKLGIIRDAIYGVDIQPIAVEISKLRFFLSLIVDEKVNDTKENRGIEPLPNLEFKFVCANSLMGLPKRDTQQTLFESDEDIKTLKNLRDEYLRSFGEEKRKIEKKFQEVQSRMFKHSLGWGGQDSQTLKLSQWNPFSEDPCSWFDSGWMFGLVDGFDVVIANPPYGADLEEDDIEKLANNYEFYDRQKNSASFFLELAARLTSPKRGVITYIVPKSLSFSEGWKKTRDLVSINNRLIAIVDVSKAFEDVLLEQVIVCFRAQKPSTAYSFAVGEGWSSTVSIFSALSNELISQLDLLPVYIDRDKTVIYKKLKSNSISLSQVSDTFRGLPIQKLVSKRGKDILRGKNIGKYSVYGDIDKVTLDAKSAKKAQEIMKDKIISQRIVAHVINPVERIIIMATIDTKPYLTLDTVMNTIIKDSRFQMKYILALLNSTLASWFYYWFVYNRAIRTMDFDKYYIGKLPIKNITSAEQKSFCVVVDKIHGLNHEDDEKRQELMRRIDQMVYDLYDLIKEEINIIESSAK